MVIRPLRKGKPKMNVISKVIIIHVIWSNDVKLQRKPIRNRNHILCSHFEDPSLISFAPKQFFAFNLSQIDDWERDARLLLRITFKLNGIKLIITPSNWTNRNFFYNSAENLSYKCTFNFIFRSMRSHFGWCLSEWIQTICVAILCAWTSTKIVIKHNHNRIQKKSNRNENGNRIDWLRLFVLSVQVFMTSWCNLFGENEHTTPKKI